MTRRVDAMFQAFADFTRLRLLHLLAQEELCVCEMTAVLKAPQPRVSRHLGRLRAAGLASSRTRGKWRYYSLAAPTTRFQARILKCLRDCHDEVGVLARDLARLKAVMAAPATRARRRARRAAAVLALLLPLAAGRARAHDYPIKPVKVVLRVEPDRVTADVDSDSIYWIEEVLGVPVLTASGWPAAARARAQDYVNAHLLLTADGKPLTGRLVSASYVQRPWQVYEQGRVRLRLVYPPLDGAKTLSGAADFFGEYLRERLANKEPILAKMVFETDLTVAGRTARRFTLTPRAETFSVPVEEAASGAAARAAASAEAGLSAALGLSAGWTALAGLALSLAPGLPPRRRLAIAALAAAAGAATWPRGPQEWPLWAGALLAALAAGRWAGAAAAPWLEAAAAALLGRGWAAAALSDLPRAAPGPWERLAACAGFLAAGGALLSAGLWAAAAERRRLSAVSESRAGLLFDRRRRLAATVLVLIGGWGLALGLPR
jgi:ArsR family transcriptional regulator